MVNYSYEQLNQTHSSQLYGYSCGQVFQDQCLLLHIKCTKCKIIILLHYKLNGTSVLYYFKINASSTVFYLVLKVITIVQFGPCSVLFYISDPCTFRYLCFDTKTLFFSHLNHQILKRNKKLLEKKQKEKDSIFMHSSHKEKINNDANGFVFKKGAPLMKVIL